MRPLIFFIFLIFLYSCSRNEPFVSRESDFVKHTINKGAHYSDRSATVAFEDSMMSYTVRFDSSAIYQTVDPSNQGDVNKVFGFSEEKGHHENSARFGWNWNNNRLEIYAYTYIEGERSIEWLTTIDIGRQYLCTISVKQSHYLFTIDGRQWRVSRSSTMPVASGYHLYPYFGGDETAPHEVHIFLRAE
ncbi:MAG TPA: hypothetical protein VM012_14445 [Flavitalea sp.]|nr:hypothetical protein [Flavitalea sp.]